MSSWDDILTEQLTHDISIDQQQHHARSLTAHPQREQDCRSPQGDDGCRCALGSLMGLSFPGGRARGSTRPAARIAFMMARYSREGLIEEGGTR